MIPIWPAILLTLSSPYFKDLKNSLRRNKSKLIDSTELLAYVLQEIQTDVYNQFTENQGKWQALAQYTVDKKKAMKADPRILHQTKVGQGVRLKDAYAEAGFVANRRLIYHYPSGKPYAHEHQEGATIESSKGRQKATSKYAESRRKYYNNQNKKLDIEFLRAVGLPDYLANI